MIGAIVLAAGRSRRMGTQKLVLPLGDKTVIARVVDVLIEARISPVIAVTGADGESIRKALAGRAVTFAVNPEPDGDMLSSVRCGLRVLPKECTGVLVALGDQPLIRAAWIQALLLAFQPPGGRIVVPVYAGRRGHPILFSGTFREEVLSKHDGVGLRGLLQAHADAITCVEVSSADVLEDLDTPEDYDRQRTRFA